MRRASSFELAAFQCGQLVTHHFAVPVVPVPEADPGEAGLLQASRVCSMFFISNVRRTTFSQVCICGEYGPEPLLSQSLPTNTPPGRSTRRTSA